MSEGKGPNVGPPIPGSADARARELIGKAIRVRREKAGMSQQEAAQALGISRDTLIRWERGEGSLWTGGDAGNVDHEMMDRLKRIYGARMDQLMPREQYPSSPIDPAHRREYFSKRNKRIQGATGTPLTAPWDRLVWTTRVQGGSVPVAVRGCRLHPDADANRIEGGWECAQCGGRPMIVFGKRAQQPEEFAAITRSLEAPPAA
jgi:transcriptional regulator with XRE-family HTH domain